MNAALAEALADEHVDVLMAGPSLVEPAAPAVLRPSSERPPVERAVTPLPLVERLELPPEVVEAPAVTAPFVAELVTADVWLLPPVAAGLLPGDVALPELAPVEAGLPLMPAAEPPLVDVPVLPVADLPVVEATLPVLPPADPLPVEPPPAAPHLPAPAVHAAPLPSAPDPADQPAVPQHPARRSAPGAGRGVAALFASAAAPATPPVTPQAALELAGRTVPVQPNGRVSLGFRDGTTTSLAVDSAQALALEELASLLTRRD